MTIHDAQGALYLKIDSIPGESTASGHENQIDISSFSFGAHKTTSTSTGLLSPTRLDDLTITKFMDVASTPLVNDVVAGKSLSTVELFLTKISNGQEFTYNHVTLNNVVISSYLASSGGDRPTEEISFSYEKISTEFIPQNPDGSAGQPISTCWDNLQQTQCSTDVIPPTTAATLSGTAGNNGWYISPVNVTLSASDNSGGSGVKTTTYSIDGGSQTTYSAPFTVTGDANHTLTFNSTDNAGNVEQAKMTHIAIDSTPPTTPTIHNAIDGNGNDLSGGNEYTNSTSIYIGFDAIDATSGVASYQCSLDNVTFSTCPLIPQLPPPNPVHIPTVQFSNLTNGKHIIQIFAVDNAGNQGPTVSFRWIVDTIPPTTTATLSGISGNNGWFTSPVSVTLSAIDNPGGSGVKTTDYSIDGASQTTYSAPFTVTGDANHTLTFNSTDNVENMEKENILHVAIDTTPPVITVPSSFSVFPTSPSGAVVTFSATNGTAAAATDATSGVATLSYSPLSGSAYPIGNTTVTVTATDNAGNTDKETFTVTVFTPAQASQQMINNIGSMSLDHGTASSLDSKLNAAINSLSSSQGNTAKNQLNAFINEINAQTGKKITQAQANQLITEVQDVINSIS